MRLFRKLLAVCQRERLPTLAKDKLDLIDFAFSRFNLHSFADLGGVWRVEGGYTFYALDKYDVSVAALVDTDPTTVFQNHARKCCATESRHRQLR